MMTFVLLIVAAAILGGVFAVATGRGGELAMARRDLADWPAVLRTPADVATARLPLGIFGYQTEATSVVLAHVARLLAERDAEIARLRGGAGDLRGEAGDLRGSADLRGEADRPGGADGIGRSSSPTA